MGSKLGIPQGNVIQEMKENPWLVSKFEKKIEWSKIDLVDLFDLVDSGF